MDLNDTWAINNRYKTTLQHRCSLDIDTPVFLPRMTGIIATIGPASESMETLHDMIAAGLNICRLNMVHGTQEYHEKLIQCIRQVGSQFDIPTHVAIAIDINGPGIRLGNVKPEFGTDLFLKSDTIVQLSNDEKFRSNMDASSLYVDHKEFIDNSSVNTLIVVEDGPLSLLVTQKGPDHLICKVVDQGELSSRQLLHIPKMLPQEARLTEKDKKDILFAIEQKVDILFISLVWNKGIVQEAKEFLAKNGGKMKVIAKIENYEGVKNANEILDEADGVMVARGNLGIDIGPEKVFLAQKKIIGRANNTGKPVICSAQMLDSMCSNVRATRAEVSDVANAILDGADCLMLSKETAKGKHPVQAVRTLAKISREAEAAVFTYRLISELKFMSYFELERTHTTAVAAVEASINCQAKVIFVVTTSGRSAELIARYRPRSIIIAVTRHPHTARHLHLHRGVFPILYEDSKDSDWTQDIDKRIHRCFSIVKKKEFVKPGDVVVLVTGWTAGSGSTNTIRILTVPSTDLVVPITQIHRVESST